MTVNTSNITSGPYDGNDVADTFGYTFRVDEADQLRVIKTDADGGQTVLVLNTDYTVTGLGVDAGGNVVLTAGPLATGESLFIRADYQYTQETSFTSQSSFFASLHEAAFDKLTFLLLQILDSVTRSFRISSDSDITGLDLEIPAPTASTVLGWNDAGTALENKTLTDGTSTIADASTTQKGIVERATDAEFLAGTDEERYVNSKQVNDNFLRAGTGGDQIRTNDELDARYSASVVKGEVISVATFTGDSVDLNSVSQFLFGFEFNDDGTQLYFVDDNNSSSLVYRFNLSTAWDVTTAVSAGSVLNISAQTSNPTGIRFAQSGATMYIVDRSSGVIYQYSLSTAYDVSTATYLSKSLNVSAVADGPWDISLNSAGTKMFIYDDNTPTVHQYSLVTPFDISTGVDDSVSLNLTAIDSDMGGAIVTSNERELIALSSGDDNRLHQFTMTNPFDLSTATRTGVTGDIEFAGSSAVQQFRFINGGRQVAIFDTTVGALRTYYTNVLIQQ